MMPSTGETSEKSRADREHDVVVLDQEIVGRIETDPAELLAAPQRHPGMGGIGALQPRLARRRDGAQIAADIGRRQAEAAQPCDHHMGEILADAVALLEHLAERRRDHRRLRVVVEFGADAVHQIDRAGEDPAPGAKARRGIGA